MGLLRALIDSAGRFRQDLLPVGYAERDIAWVISLHPAGQREPMVARKQRGELRLAVPDTPADRTSGKVSPTLLVDKPSYVLAQANEKKADAQTIAVSEHAEFLNLLQKAAAATGEADLKAISDLLNASAAIDRLRFTTPPKPSELIAFQVADHPWPTDSPKVQGFWSSYMEQRLGGPTETCVSCGLEKPALRILPFRIRLQGYRVQLSSFNEDAFCSHGNNSDSALNAPICYTCAGTATQVLQHLLELDTNAQGGEKLSGRHVVVLARDDSKGQGKQPLRNQIAILWTKNPVALETVGSSADERGLTFEDAVRLPLGELEDGADVWAPPAYASQLRQVLEIPFAGGLDHAQLATNRFYLAVLSPNKSRLVVREWLEHDVASVKESIGNYVAALRVIHPDGRGTWFPPMHTMLDALRSVTSNRSKSQERGRLPHVGPDIIRKLIRCAFAGQAPPETLMIRGVRCFRVPDLPADGDQQERQLSRRMAMAAAMKLVLTHGHAREEQRAMEELKTEHDERCAYKRGAPYQCGRLLAILEAAQRRASSSGRGVNTTQVDRFYGAASTAPAVVFANLIGLATKGHLAKLRRESKELFRTRSSGETPVNINDLMADACNAIDEAGGFPPPLSPEQQAQFALGFYHQRADFNAPRKGPAPTTRGARTGHGGQK